MPFVSTPSRMTARIVPEMVPLPPLSAAPPSAPAVLACSYTPTHPEIR